MFEDFYAKDVPQVMIAALSKAGFKVEIKNSVRTLTKRFEDDICLHQHLRMLRGNKDVNVTVNESGAISIIKADDTDDFITVMPDDSTRWSDIARHAGVRTPKWIDELYSLDVNITTSGKETGYKTEAFNISLNDAKKIARKVRSSSPASDFVFRILNSEGEIALVSSLTPGSPRFKWATGNMRKRCDSPPLSNAKLKQCPCGHMPSKPTYSPLVGYKLTCENHGPCKRMTSSTSTLNLVKYWNKYNS